MSNKREGQFPAFFFVAAVGFSAVLYTVIYTCIGDGRFSDIFFIRCADFYMDFFNSVRDAAQGSGVYTERGVIYPPMANLIFLFFSRFMPNDYNSTSFTERYEWREYFSPMMLALTVSLVLALILFYAVFTALGTRSAPIKFLFAFFAVFNMPVLYTVERGNILLLCLICLLLYALTYNSERTLVREIGLISLAFAFSLKLYPVIFGWTLIADRRIKDALRCALYGVMFLIIPSFFFGGPACLDNMIQNIFNFSAGDGSTLERILSFFKLSDTVRRVLTVLAYLWVFVCGAAFAISAFVRRQAQWKTWICGLTAILCIPSLTAPYSWAFFIIPLLLMCNRAEECRGRNVAYVIMTSLPFIFLPFRINLHVSTGHVLIYIMTAALSVFAVVDLIWETVRRRNKEKI